MTLATIDIEADILRVILRMADSHKLPIAKLASSLLREGLAATQKRQKAEAPLLDQQLGLPLLTTAADDQAAALKKTGGQ